VRSLYASGLHKTVARELAKYGLDLVGVCQVRCGKGSGEQAEDYTFFYEREMKIIDGVQEFFIHQRIMSAVEFVGDWI